MYIFFDCDGVINQLQPNYYIDADCVYHLAKLAINFGAKLIIASTWGTGFSYNMKFCTPQIKELRELLRYNRADIYGVIRELEPRHKKIKEYIEHNKFDTYLILDDDKLLYKDVIDDNLYFVNAKTGLTEKDVKVLTRKYYKRAFKS